jgi:hypothetical protein
LGRRTHQTTLLTQSSKDETISFINAIGNKGRLKIKIYTTLISKSIEYGFILDGIGISVE